MGIVNYNVHHFMSVYIINLYYYSLVLIQINRSLQRLVESDIDIYKSADELNEGEKLWHRVLKVLDKKYHKLGKNSDPFKREMEWYSELFKSTFYNLMVGTGCCGYCNTTLYNVMVVLNLIIRFFKMK